MMLKNYERLGLVDTGTYDLAAAGERVAPLAGKLNLGVERLDGDNSWLERLLLGPYDDPSLFLVIPPHGDLNFEQWKMFLENPMPLQG